MSNTTTKTTLEQQLKVMVPQWTRLFKALKQDITDDMRPDECGECTPGMQVTIGFTPANYNDNGKDASWGYQTGDNSYTGAAYRHPHWAVVSLYRRSNSRNLATECADQLGELAWLDAQ